MRDLLHTIHDNRSRASATARRLSALADALRMVGNATLAEEMEDIAEHVSFAAQMVSDAFSEDLKANHRAAMSHAAGVLNILINRADGEKAQL